MIKKGELITGRTQVLVFLKAEDKNFIDPRVKNKSSLSPSKKNFESHTIWIDYLVMHKE